MKCKTLTVTILLSTVFLLTSCKKTQHEKEKASEMEVSAVMNDTDYRPNFHFTPKENWMNDPNGMFYLDGTYHLFYQYHPDSSTWGPMHWGHATSKDMIRWEHQPVALFPDEHGWIFSGSAVVDKNNTSGLGEDNQAPIVALYTYHDSEGEKQGRDDFQTQGLAYSLDQGKTWIKYKNNPVIKNPGIRDFRDPKVTWDAKRNQWVMALATYEKTLFYTSKNLIDWDFASEFGEGIGAHGGVWECPDLIKMEVAGTNEEKWVLIQSLNPGAYNSGSGTQYFVGDFDGKNFVAESYVNNLGEKHNYWIDFGKDNYAGVTWSNAPKGRTLFIGWMSNWEYANVVPTQTWRSTSTIARELKLVNHDGTYRIVSSPVQELDSYMEEQLTKESIAVSKPKTLLTVDDVSLSKTKLSFEIPDLKPMDYRFLLTNAIGDSLIFGYNHSENQFYIDRSKSGKVDFNEQFAKKPSVAPRIAENKKLEVTILLDKTSIELFYDQGSTVMTEIFFSKNSFQEFKALTNQAFTIQSLKVSELKL